MRGTWQEKKKQKKTELFLFKKEMLQAYVSLQQAWPCKVILIYFKAPKEEQFCESYILFLIDDDGVYT